MTMVKQYTQVCVRSVLHISPVLFPIVTRTGITGFINKEAKHTCTLNTLM